MGLIRKYKITTNNEEHFCNNRTAVLVELEEGLPGVFVIQCPEDMFCSWHRVITSRIKAISNVTENEIVVKTENTEYTFSLIKEGDN